MGWLNLKGERVYDKTLCSTIKGAAEQGLKPGGELLNKTSGLRLREPGAGLAEGRGTTLSKEGLHPSLVAAGEDKLHPRRSLAALALDSAKPARVRTCRPRPCHRPSSSASSEAFGADLAAPPSEHPQSRLRHFQLLRRRGCALRNGKHLALSACS